MSSKITESNIALIPESLKSATQIYADGLGVMIGIPVSKIQFQASVGLDEKTGKELRQVTVQATIPTSTLIEFCQNTLKGIAENEKALSNALGVFNDKVLSTAAKNK
jgi:hypothetical protein